MPALMLDVDGVLIADTRPWTRALQADLGIAPAQLRQHFFDKHWHKIIVGTVPIEEPLTLALEQIGSAVSAEELLAYWFEQDAELDQGVLADVEALRADGCKIYLTTNQEHRRAAYLMDQLSLKRYVDGIVFSASLGARKPHAGFFQGAMKATGLHPSEHLLVDDSVANIKGASKAGWHARHWSGAQRLSSVYRSFFA